MSKWHPTKKMFPPELKTKDGFGAGISEEVIVIVRDLDTGKDLRRIAYYDFRRSVWKQKMIITDVDFDPSVEILYWQHLGQLLFDNYEKPLNYQKVNFIHESIEFEGYYIEDEDLFMIGFSDECDFIYRQFVSSWRAFNNELKFQQP